MGRAIRITIIAGAACVPTVIGVPAFAQSGSVSPRPAIALERTSAAAAREYVPVDLGDAAPAALPSNLLIPDVYRRMFESTLRRSPTFARQCIRIANARELTVTLDFAMATSRPARPARARTEIVRRDNRLLATIVIAQTIDVVELVAHEIEHVIEQLDGVDLAAKAQIPDSGVQALRHDRVVFETIRAQRVGRQVADECRRPAWSSARTWW